MSRPPAPAWARVSWRARARYHGAVAAAFVAFAPPTATTATTLSPRYRPG